MFSNLRYNLYDIIVCTIARHNPKNDIIIYTIFTYMILCILLFSIQLTVYILICIYMINMKNDII